MTEEEEKVKKEEQKEEEEEKGKRRKRQILGCPFLGQGAYSFLFQGSGLYQTRIYKREEGERGQVCVEKEKVSVFVDQSI